MHLRGTVLEGFPLMFPGLPRMYHVAPGSTVSERRYAAAATVDNPPGALFATKSHTAAKLPELELWRGFFW